MIVVLLLVASATAVQVFQATQPPVPGDLTRAPATATAIISGRVTDRETGQPLAGIVITLGGRERPVQTRTGDDGRYMFRALPAGKYYVAAVPTDHDVRYLRQAYGDERPMIPGRPSRREPLSIADGERRDNVDLALWRSLAISGRVVDAFGEPMANVAVYAEDWSTASRWGSGAYRPTDDRGIFRLFALSPGHYRICAESQSSLRPWEDVSIRPIRTCYPSAVVDADAQTVVLTTTEVGGIDIRMQRSRTFTVGGTVVDSAGARVEHAMVTLIRRDRHGASSNSVETRPGGGFVARGLAPGDYAIGARIGDSAESGDLRTLEAAYVPIRVDTEDIDGVVVMTSKLTTVAGKVVFEDTPPEQIPSSMQVSVGFDRAERRMMMGRSPMAVVRPDLTFELRGLFGPSLIGIRGFPQGWVVRAIRYKGEDITEKATAFQDSGDSRPLEILLTSRVATLRGKVFNASGTTEPRAMVILLTAARVPWTSIEDSGGMWRAWTERDGSFRLGPLRAGEYLVVAFPEDELGTIDPGIDASRLIERLARVAERLTLVDNEQRTMDLTIATLPK